MLDGKRVPYRYREMTREPLSRGEIRAILGELGVEPAAVLRRNDRAFRELELTGEEPAERLIALMAEHPTLLQRPIGRAGGKAVVGRPPERLLDLI